MSKHNSADEPSVFSYPLAQRAVNRQAIPRERHGQPKPLPFPVCDAVDLPPQQRAFIESPWGISLAQAAPQESPEADH